METGDEESKHIHTPKHVLISIFRGATDNAAECGRQGRFESSKHQRKAGRTLS